MELTLTEAAAQLGKTPRQVRYLIQKGQLEARKRGGAWIIDSDKLPRSDAQVQAGLRKQQQLRAVVEETLELDDRPKRRRYSFKQLRATTIAIPLYQNLVATLGANHCATQSLHHVVEHLACGCHRFSRSEKTVAYQAARDEASRAACALALCSEPKAEVVGHGHDPGRATFAPGCHESRAAPRQF